MTAPTVVDTSLAIALNDYARAADQEANHARTLRDQEVRRLREQGVNMSELAEALGVARSMVYKIANENAG